MTDDLALEIAADWADRIGELDAAERRDLIAWLNQDPAHAQAFSRMHALLRDPALLELLEARHEATIAPSVATPRSTSRRRIPAALQRRRGVGLAAIAAGLAAAVAVPMLLREPVPAGGPVAAPAGERFASAVGERRTLRLSDGSTMTLDAASTVVTRFAARARNLELERGAARFDVAHDASRPFQVWTPQARFTALGTNFSVDRLQSAVELRVYRGRVRVDAAGAAPVVLTAGEWTRVGTAPSGIRRFDLKADDGWQDKWLNADQMRLDAALERIGRYSAVPIRLADPPRGAERFSGRFRLDTPAESAALIGALFGLEPERGTGGLVLGAKPRQ